MQKLRLMKVKLFQIRLTGFDCQHQFATVLWVLHVVLGTRMDSTHDASGFGEQSAGYE